MAFAGPPLMESINLPDLLPRGLAAKPDGDALVSLETRWTWRQLDETSDCLARNLLEKLAASAGEPHS